MKTADHASGWFDQLRRERGLFALVGALLLLLNMFQPGSIQPNGWIVCHGLGDPAEPGGAPDTPRPDCPICLAGLCTPVAASGKALPPFGAAFAAPAAEAGSHELQPDHVGVYSPSDAPPAIRAPPFDA